MTAVSVDEALAALLGATAPQPTLRMPLRDSLGHVLAERVTARAPLPPWTAAAMDGYAVRADDVLGATPTAPRSLPLAGGADAGGPPPPPLPPGTAWRVATGGRVPPGADSVIRQEDTSVGEAGVTFLGDRDARRNLRPAGGDLAAGTAALEAGTIIGPGQLALLAALGVTAPMVIRSPRVATLTSGDELVPANHLEPIHAGERLADVNAPLLEALVSAAGGVVAPIGLLPDDRDALTAAVAASSADLILSAGAVSVGAQDHVPGAMADLGAQLLFRRVRLRPGGPTTAARLPDGRLWLALPGNPVSAWVTFLLFARPVLRALLGDPRPVTAPRPVRLAEPVARHPTLELFPRVTLSGGDAGQPPLAHLTGDQGSWVLTSIARADGIVRVAAGQGSTDGAPVPFLAG